MLKISYAIWRCYSALRRCLPVVAPPSSAFHFACGNFAATLLICAILKRFSRHFAAVEAIRY